MGKCTWAKELWVKGKNVKGELAKLTAPVAEAKVNITALCGVGQGADAWFWLVTDNNTKAREVLSKAGLKVEERDCCCVELPDKPGTCWDVATKLSDGGINIDHWYHASCGGSTAKVYFSCDNCQKAAQLLG
ncbi:MAG: acetolactate synthase [Deltaproteobacteria bacterium]|nr:acetolactate synthase [Deltaproteobacteria bacterium]